MQRMLYFLAHAVFICIALVSYSVLLIIVIQLFGYSATSQAWNKNSLDVKEY